ncbi:TonB-dependent receptor [Flavipsychrobacter stenotrophus]|nr:TonB-dependent receptor [Flavipsychrobacter stenotrophus]
MHTRFSFFLFSLLFLSLSSFAQPFNITGRVIDATDTTALIGVTVMVKSATDSTLPVNGGVTDADGNFSVAGVNAGTYKVTFAYVGYKTANQTITVSAADVQLGTIKLVNANKELKSVTIKDKQTRATQLGDTSQFNADAYKTHPDASAEDLVTKMPGVTSDANGVKVNGESLQQVYVDGKPFFGNDPSLALKNLPAEIIDKIQVFDKLSDQSSFTGFDDGTSQKTMNIITKGGKREGVFGKVYAGYGTDDRYSTGGNLNFFKGDRRITVVGMSNNINQQNFSAQDLLGVTSGSGGNRGGGGGGRGNFGGGGGGGNNGSNFFVGQSNGITTTNSIGFNYADNWGKKLKVSGSYFFNSTDNGSRSDITQNYHNIDLFYHDLDTSESSNTNHRVNLRFEYTMDSFNTIIFTPGISFQQNNTSLGQYLTYDSTDAPLSRSRNFNAADNSGYSSSNNLLFQHKFKKQRRTISLNISNSINAKNGTGMYRSYTTNFTPAGDSVLTNYDQQYTLDNNGYSISPNVTYTEPVGKKGQVMFTYNPSFSASTSDKETFNKDSVTNAYNDFNQQLSNKYNNTYNTQRGGLSYRVGDKKMTFSVGANMQYAMLEGVQTFPYNTKVERNFTSVLPTAMYNYRYTDGRNLRVMYRTNTQAPSVTQLQNVVDVSNPVLLKTGNPDLQQDYEHTLIVRYGMTKSKTQRNFFFNFYGNYINNYISTATLQPSSDSVYRGQSAQDTILIRRGNQLTLPINVNGYFNERAFLTYSLPVQFIKSNLNLSAGLNFT